MKRRLDSRRLDYDPKAIHDSKARYQKTYQTWEESSLQAGKRENQKDAFRKSARKKLRVELTLREKSLLAGMPSALKMKLPDLKRLIIKTKLLKW